MVGVHGSVVRNEGQVHMVILHIFTGFADEKKAGGTGGISLSGSDMSLLQKYVASEAKVHSFRVFWL